MKKTFLFATLLLFCSLTATAFGQGYGAGNRDFSLRHLQSSLSLTPEPERSLGADLRVRRANEQPAAALAAMGRRVSRAHGGELVLVGPMVDVAHKFCLRPLGRMNLAQAARLGRDDNTGGLNRRRNSGNRTSNAESDPGNN